MVEILATSDPVRLSFVRAALRAADIDSVVFDSAAPWPGAIPSRLIVADRDAWMARHVLADAERDAGV